VPSFKERMTVGARKEDYGLRSPEICEVLEVFPHLAPWDGDRNFFVVDLLLKNRLDPMKANFRRRCLCLQHDPYFGHCTGTTWMPRLGDLVLLFFIHDNKAIVLGQLPNSEQEPVCKPRDSQVNYDYIRKRAKFILPAKDCCTELDYVYFYEPESPVDCNHWYHKTGDELFCWDCPEGIKGVDPHCLGCLNIDYIKRKTCTFIKNHTSESDTQDNLPGRFIFSHRSGSVVLFDDDGTLHIVNQELATTNPNAHITLSQDGTLEVHGQHSTAINESLGARLTLSPDGKCELKHLANGANITINADGTISISTAGVITLTSSAYVNVAAPALKVNGTTMNVP
jgi:hypothetical protein